MIEITLNIRRAEESSQDLQEKVDHAISCNICPLILARKKLRIKNKNENGKPLIDVLASSTDEARRRTLWSSKPDGQYQMPHTSTTRLA